MARSVIMRHTSSAYRNGRCRCEICCAENTARMRVDRQRRAERLRADSSVVEHGRTSTYRNWNCRCESCTSAHSASCALYYQRRRALVAKGSS